MRGGSQSRLLQASDDACYVTKFQNNPQHVRVLANEMFATNLGVVEGTVYRAGESAFSTRIAFLKKLRSLAGLP
jgi:hypothetical protein